MIKCAMSGCSKTFEGKVPSGWVVETGSPPIILCPEHGPMFKIGMDAFLESTGFDQIPKSTRDDLVEVMANLPAIEEWRSSLNAQEQSKLHHPSDVLAAWKKARAA